MSNYPEECPVFIDAGGKHGEIVDWYYMEQDAQYLVAFTGGSYPLVSWYFLNDLVPLTPAARRMAKDIAEGAK